MDIFLDESGDLGFNFELRGTSKYFVISTIIIDKENAPSFRTSIRRKLIKLKKRHKIPKSKEVKAYHASEQFFMGMTDLICRQPIKIHSIILKKENTFGRLRDNTQIIYNYLCGILLSTVLMEQTEVRLVLDPRSAETVRPLALPEYLETKVLEGLVSDNRHGEIGRLNLSIERPESSQCPELQVVDFVANATFRAFERNNWTMRSRLNRKVVREERWFFSGS